MTSPKEVKKEKVKYLERMVEKLQKEYDAYDAEAEVRRMQRRRGEGQIWSAVYIPRWVRNPVH